ncbi:major facilitator superfamily transporter [Seiridium cupressi]
MTVPEPSASTKPAVPTQSVNALDMGDGLGMADAKLYFAYGSNLSSTQMARRCPNSIAVGLAWLPGWDWIINERRYANIVQHHHTSPSSSSPAEAGEDHPGVYGVLYRLPPADEITLDGCEGVPWAYEKVVLDVTTLDETGQEKKKKKVKALVYVDFNNVKPDNPWPERIGLAVQAQIERDRERAALITHSSGASPHNVNHHHQQHAGIQQLAEPAVLAETVVPEPAGEKTLDLERQVTSSRSSSSSSNSDEDPGTAAYRTQTVATQYTARAALGHSLTGIHARDRATHEGKGSQVFVVGWEGPDDPASPRNWTVTKRVCCTLQISIIAAAVGCASGIDATILPQAAADLGVSDVAESLATGMYLVGQGVGSLIAGPFSETFGRNFVYAGSMVVFMLFIMASGLAPNFGAQITFRFFAGCAASTPLVCSGGSVSDMFNGLEKTWGFPLYAIAAFGGPMLGAVMGAYIGPSPLVSWRWTEWTTLILAGVVVVLTLLFMPETYAPLLLQWKAAHLRRITGDDRYRSQHEIVDATLLSRLKVSMTRPFIMLTEPIIMAMTLYLSVVYIVLFTFLIGWPWIFEYPYEIGQGLSNVIFIAMFVGLQFTFILIPVIYRITTKQIKIAESRGEGSLFDPEVRLWYAMLGSAISIPVSLFWMGWTANSSISIWSPILAVGLFGYGVMGVFICAYMYIIDSYEVYSASALTFVALVRYVCAGGMTVVGIPFYENMGTAYTLTILACISCLLAPIPYVLFKWGHLLRKRSKYAISREI